MESSFTVSPMKKEITLEPGETYEGYIVVANPSTATQNFSFKASISPYSITNDKYEPDFETQSDWSQIVEWMKLDDTEGTLAPNETKKVHYKITVPESAPAGGQYAMIGITSANNGASEGGVGNVYRVASLIYADIAGTTVRNGKIINNTVPGFVASGTPTTTVEVANEGNVHEKVKTTITVKNVFSGEKMHLSDAEEDAYESLVMPETTRTISRNLEGLPQLGIFEVTQDVSYLGQDSTVTGTLILCPIWFIALVAATIVSIVGMVCYGVHLRHKKKARLSGDSSAHQNSEEKD